jgi:hypothetical protein
MESREITVRFSPLATGAAAAVFAVISNDPVNGNVPFNVSGTGFIPKITLSLSPLRQVERAWLIRRAYGIINLTVTKSAPFNVATYRLFRKAGPSGTFGAIKDFTEAHLVTGNLSYIDMFLATNVRYFYRVDALDCGGRVIATSGEVEISDSSIFPQTRQTKTRIVKRVIL